MQMLYTNGTPEIFVVFSEPRNDAIGFRDENEIRLNIRVYEYLSNLSKLAGDLRRKIVTHSVIK